MHKFQDKYRIPSARLVGWDYTKDSAYFITICTANHKHFFGKCKNGVMKLSTSGAIVQGFWYEITKHFPFIILGEFVVMPNHIHGILILDKANYEESSNQPTTDETPRKDNLFSQISPKSGSVSVIIGSYKSICTKHIKTPCLEMNFAWQERFWDNIIKDEQAFENISNYIRNNPKNWKEDKFFDEINI